jgi:hypothetical protein
LEIFRLKFIAGVYVIEIEAVLKQDETLKTCKASGHSGAGKTGTDIVCAAVSVLLRTAIYTLSNQKGITVCSGAPEKGQLWLEVNYDKEGKDFLVAAGKFLINGLSSVAQEFPQNCKLVIRTEE